MFLSAPSAQSHGEVGMMNVHELMDKDSFVLFVGLMDTNPTDFQK